MKQKNVAIWIRVSTDDQAKGDSPEHHEERARMYAKVKNWNVRTVYNLAGVSGKDVMSHPEAERMMLDIKRGYISGLIFSKIARLARNTKQLIEFSEMFSKYNADLISIYENIDTSSPAGKLFYTIIGAMAQWEREEIASRVKHSAEVRAKLGKKMGNQAQFGFKWEGDELVLNDKEAPIRKLMYELFLKEKRKAVVEKQLNEMGYRTRNGKKFNRVTIKRWLRDPISKGERRTNYSEQNSETGATQLKPKDSWYYHACPAIVSKELWQQVNDILDEQDRIATPILNRKVHIFTNYIFCHCGNRMNVRSRLTSYKCTNNDCKNKILRTDLEEAFRSRLDEFLSNDTEIQKYFSESMENLTKNKLRLKHLRKEYTSIQEKLHSLLTLYQKGKIPTEAFDEYHNEPYEESKKLKAKISILEDQIKVEEVKHQSSQKIINESKDFYNEWKNFDRDKKREIIESVIESVIIGQEEIIFNMKHLTPPMHFSKNRENDEHNPYLQSYLH
jgi:site-specific DNA recombinase